MSISIARLLELSILLAIGGSAMGGSAQEVEGIAIYPPNPRYWQYDGRPALLLGGSVEDNLFQVPNTAKELDRLVDAGGNYVRCTMSSRDEGNVQPFRREDHLYDLTRPNEEYWNRFAQFLEETARRDVIVQVEVWATFDFYRENWERNPFNPKNNSNYTAADTALPTAVDSHPVKTENNFFQSVPTENNRMIVLKYQRLFVDRLLSHSLECDHVLYCIDNETSVTAEWGAYWAGYIRKAAEKAGKKVHVTEMWDPHDLEHPMHRATFDHPELYSFVDISQNNHQTGRQHYENALEARARLAAAPRPMNNVKVYGADGGRHGNTRNGLRRFWRSVFAGCASARFHRPPSGLGIGELARPHIKAARQVTDAVGVVDCEPHPDLVSGTEGESAYCLADPGRAYALYLPDGGETALNLEEADGELELRWYSLAEGSWGEAEPVKGGATVTLEPPGDGQYAAVIR